MNRENIICITNRALVRGDFFTQLARLAAARPRAVIVREKDLSPAEYERLAARALTICRAHGVACILHTYVQAALHLQADAIHMPLAGLLAMTEQEKRQFAVIGASAHSVEEAQTAQAAGAAYITASHIFATDCKRGLAPRGLSFLQTVCGAVHIPVYALGGICADNASSCMEKGAAGVCIMSAGMQCADADSLFREM